MEDPINVLQEEQNARIQLDIEKIISTRQQLFNFVPTPNNLIMTFKLEDGNQVQVPIRDPYKVRMLIREVRDYLSEQELLKERQLHTLIPKVNA